LFCVLHIIEGGRRFFCPSFVYRLLVSNTRTPSPLSFLMLRAIRAPNRDITQQTNHSTGFFDGNVIFPPPPCVVDPLFCSSQTSFPAFLRGFTAALAFPILFCPLPGHCLFSLYRSRSARRIPLLILRFFRFYFFFPINTTHVLLPPPPQANGFRPSSSLS